MVDDTVLGVGVHGSRHCGGVEGGGGGGQGEGEATDEGDMVTGGGR